MARRGGPPPTKSSERSLTAQVAGGAAWTLSAKVLVRACGFLSVVILARLLTPEDFGLVALGLSASLIATSMTGMPVGLAVIKFREVTADDWNTAWTLSALRGLLVGAGIAVLGWPLQAVYDDPRLVPIMMVLGASVVFQGLSNIRFLQFEKDMAFAPRFVMETSARVAAFGVAVSVAFATGSYWAIILGDVTIRIVRVLVTYILGPKILPRFCLRSWRRLLSFSGWLSVAQFLSALNNRLDHFIVGAWLGKSTLGQYSLGQDFSTLPTQELITPLVRTLFPAFSTIQDDHARLSEAYLRVQSVIFAVGFPLGVGLSLVAHNAVPVVLGAQWTETVVVVQFLAAAMGLRMLTPGVYPLVMAAGETRQLFWRELILLAIWLPAVVLGLAVAGLIGLLVARVVTQIFFAGLNLALVRSVIRVPITRSLYQCRRSIIACGAMSAVVLSLSLVPAMAEPLSALPDWQVLIIEIGLGGLTYCVTHAGLWLVQGRPAGIENFLLSNIKQLRRAG